MTVDEYDAFINNPSPDKNVNPSKALSYLYVHGPAEFSQGVVVTFIQTMSVYPPGTVVQLTDGSLGLVVSINFKICMRPLALLDDPRHSSR
jgi:HD-GYP domain-containing protein (c-di-GMP phosphodiesterase class II)